MNTRPEGRDSIHPGNRFTESYATIAESRDGELTYSTFSDSESLEEYLRENAVEAVRINADKQRIELLEVYEESYAVSSSAEERRAILFGDAEKVVFGSETLEETVEEVL